MGLKRSLIAILIGMSISAIGTANSVPFVKLCLISALAGAILGLAYQMIDSLEDK